MTLNTPKSNLMLIHSKIKKVGLECDICYKRINKTYFRCGSPCSKAFHTGCIEKMMEQTEESANETDDEPNYRCCYCRRDIEINNYLLQHFSQKLIAMHGETHDIREALKKNVYMMMMGEYKYDYLEDGESLTIYELIDTSYIKKPKQPKRQILKKRVCNPPKIRIKQNIGGRRR